MPYLEPSLREGIDPTQHMPRMADCAGELNFQFSRIIDLYLKSEGLTYRNINNAIGALECAKLELYRRVAVPYEEYKRIENGDVYSEDVIYGSEN